LEALVDLYFEDLREGIAFETGPFVLSAAEIDDFARLWDPQPFHLEGQSHPDILGGQFTSGLHSLAATFREFVIANVFSNNITIGVGYNNVRFLRPVYADQSLRAITTLVSKRLLKSRPQQGLLTWQITTRSGNEVLLEAEVINFIRRTPERP
jgi:acyl dehydratase